MSLSVDLSVSPLSSCCRRDGCLSDRSWSLRRWEKTVSKSLVSSSSPDSPVTHSSPVQPEIQDLQQTQHKTNVSEKVSSDCQSYPRISKIVSSTSSSVSSVSNMLLLVVVIVGILGNVQPAAGCSSRSTPKPRHPSSHFTSESHLHGAISRPNITFQTYACPPAYAAFFCLNGATCFTVKIGESIEYNCECADGYTGQRCEYKDLDGSYTPTRDRLIGPMLRTLHLNEVGFGAVATVVAFAIVCAIVTKIRSDNRRKRNNDKQTSTVNEFGGVEMCSVETTSQIGEQSISYNISRHFDVIRGYDECEPTPPGDHAPFYHASHTNRRQRAQSIAMSRLV